jgi:D-glycero-alpha-D-manno-heptose-7-phosphate kinase
VILTRSPLRVSLAGGGSDLPSFYQTSFGQVLSFTINKYVYVASHSLFQGGIRLHYSENEEVERIDQIRHPLLRNSLIKAQFNGSLELGSFADVPGSGTGLGSSSAFTAAVLHSLHQLNGDAIDKHDLARAVCEVEINLCAEPIGKQDQYATVFGGLNHFTFHSDNLVSVNQLSNESELLDFLSRNLLLVYLGFGRSASEILRSQNRALVENHDVVKSTELLRDLVPEMLSTIMSGDSSKLGMLLDYSWRLKSSLSRGISNAMIDDIYGLALNSGSLGGKILGAGGGGFLLSVVPPEKREEFRVSMSKFSILEFKVETQGTHTVYTSER